MRLATAPARDEVRVAEAGLAVGERRTFERGDRTAGGGQDGVTGGGVPFHRSPEARIEVRDTLREPAELERRARNDGALDALAHLLGLHQLLRGVGAADGHDRAFGRRRARGNRLEWRTDRKSVV